MTTAAKYFFSWNTTKTATGFECIVKKLTPTADVQPNGHYCITEEVLRLPYKTRAEAAIQAKKSVRALNARAILLGEKHGN